MLVRRLQPVQKTGDTSETMSSTMLRGVRRLMESRLATHRFRTSLPDVWSNITLLEHSRSETQMEDNEAPKARF